MVPEGFGEGTEQSRAAEDSDAPPENIGMVEMSKKSKIRDVAITFYALLCLAYGYIYYNNRYNN